MTIFIFGDGPDSWLIANNSRMEFNQLPASYQMHFSTGKINGMNLVSTATGPNGRCFFKLYDGSLFVSQNDQITPYASTASHVTFSPSGGFFLLNTTNPNNNIAHGLLPVSFILHTEALALKHAAYQYVFFGCGDFFLFRYTNGVSWEVVRGEGRNLELEREFQEQVRQEQARQEQVRMASNTVIVNNPPDNQVYCSTLPIFFPTTT
ncbi:hypothetical protein G7Y89_g6883 [Cudoniella acicularis]|uniref:Uncharacterized protein n=1 Tax=Cudoniella acicularis TaxID=354080 RepID=A0A8H4RJN1_9HELO|nr:hypothetical protein G7Y89_g6883 [Cudoniella acicularis]